MKTIEIQLYSFDELSATAQQNAIEKLSDINVDFNWWESTYEDAENVGLKITSFDLDRNRHAEGEFIQGANFCAEKIISEHGENCQTYKTAKEFLKESLRISNENDGNFEDEQYEEFTDIENQFCNDLLENYSNILQNESEYLQSEEAIKETILANEYDFTENGSIY